ncbi:uncharacterized protein BYT42DRAFT_550614, partial [Radiomyces spectabilis]|uniref:uncharacterized protein n=1 Tax=Radiomyces spectabilis TaxID=64574 RepID=UPI00221FBB38
MIFPPQSLAPYPSSKKEFDFLPKRPNITNWTRGLYHLKKKEPTGLNPAARVIGRKQANIQPCYDEIKEAPPSVFTMNAFKKYIEAIARNHQKLHTFNCTFCHMEKRALVYSQRQMVLDKMADTLLGDPAEPKTCKKNAQRNERRPEGATVVAYGDVDLKPMKPHASVPIKVLARKSMSFVRA